MSAVQQLYWTHCTYATSVFQRRQGERSSDVLGYSVRASSLQPHELRTKFDYIEKRIGLPVYELPADTPNEERPSLGPASAPRRLIYHPSPTGLQVLAHISYRSKDTSKPPRIGSYFGHVLFAEAEGRSWNVLDCLRLWAGPWEDSDSPAIDDVSLEPVAELADLHRGAEPVVGDDLLLSFLTTPQGEPFLKDPQHVLPTRWSTIAPQSRIDLLAETLRAALADFGSNRHILLVVEPAVAAVLFYGVLRLLADEDLRNRMSFSTFEPDPARTRVALAATTFYQPDRSELKQESGAGSNFARNTFRDVALEAARREDDYAQLVVDTLVTSGWVALDGMFRNFQAAQPRGPQELEAVASAHRSAVSVLLEGSVPPKGPWQQSLPARRLVGNVVRTLFSGGAKQTIRPEALFDGSNHEVLLDLLLAEPQASENQTALRFILERAPEERLPDLLQMPALDTPAKTSLVARHINRTGRFPARCDLLWQPQSQIEPQAKALVPPLVQILAAVDSSRLAALSESIPPEHRLEFFLLVIELASSQPERAEAVRLAERFFTVLPEKELCDLLRQHEKLLVGYAAPSRKALGMRLVQLLNLVPLNPEQFDERLELLERWISAFPDSTEAERRLAAWRTIRELLLTLGPEKQAKRTPWLDFLFGPSSQSAVTRSSMAGRKLIEAVRKAMPTSAYEDPGGILKFKSLQDLAAHLLGNEVRSHDQLWWDLRESLANPDIPYGSRPRLTDRSGAKSKARRPKRPLGRTPQTFLRRHLPLLAASAATLVLLGIVLFLLWRPHAQQDATPQSPAATQPSSPSPPQPRPPSKGEKPHTPSPSNQEETDPSETPSNPDRAPATSSGKPVDSSTRSTNPAFGIRNTDRMLAYRSSNSEFRIPNSLFPGPRARSSAP